MGDYMEDDLKKELTSLLKEANETEEQIKSKVWLIEDNRAAVYNRIHDIVYEIETIEGMENIIKEFEIHIPNPKWLKTAHHNTFVEEQSHPEDVQWCDVQSCIIEDIINRLNEKAGKK